MDRPRHSNKEIRQFANWLVDQGWIFDSLNSEGKAIYYYPKKGTKMLLPETPSARYGMITMLRRQAYKLMGIKEPGKSKQRKGTTDQARMVRARRDEVRLRRDLGKLDQAERDLHEAITNLLFTAENMRANGHDPTAIHHKIGTHRATLFAVQDKRAELETLVSA